MKPLKKQQGASVFEFLIVIPVLVILAYTAIEFGAVFTRLNTIHKSVQDAARYLSATAVSKTNTAAQKTIAVNLIKYGSVSAGTQLLPGTIGTPEIKTVGAANDHVSVSVTYDHTPIMGQALSNLLQLIGAGEVDLSFQLQASSIMRYVQ
jgi:Flp pilus assembly protein TadG